MFLKTLKEIRDSFNRKKKRLAGWKTFEVTNICDILTAERWGNNKKTNEEAYTIPKHLPPGHTRQTSRYEQQIRPFLFKCLVLIC